MDRIMMKFDDLLEMKSSLDFPISDLGIVRDWANNFSARWWVGSGGENLKSSMSDWSFQLQGIMDDLEKLYKRLDYEVEEWMTTDLKYDYEGEEIDSVKELEQLFRDVLTGDLQPGDLMMTIDVKEILSPYLPADLVYPPEIFSIWVKVGDEWVRTEFTGPDWDLDLILNAETRTAFIDWSWNAGSMDILASLGSGYVVGWSYSFLSIDASAGFLYGTPVAGVGAFLFSGEAFIGRNIGDSDFTGYYIGANALGIDKETGYKFIGVTPHGVSAGLPWLGEISIGPVQDKPRDPTPPDRVP
jgi:hypothetical protein